jgi:two-component system sensor histidine kinase HydH
VETIRAHGMAHLMVAPMFVRGTAWGLLLVSGELSSRDAAAVSLFASQIGSTLEVASRLVQLERQNRWLMALHSVAIDFSDVTENEIIQKITPAIALATESDAVAIYLRISENELKLVDTSGAVPPILKQKYDHLELDPAITGFSNDMQPQTLTLADWPEPMRSDMKGAGYQHSAIIPFYVRNRLVGTVNLARTSGRAFPPAELKSATMLSAQLAVHLERVRLFGELVHSYEALEKTQQELVKRERLAALGELAAVIAHEVRNPLGVIYNSVASLRRHSLKEESLQLLDYLSEESERLNRMVSDLLDFARPHEPDVHPHILEELVTQAVKEVERTGALQGIQLTQQIPMDLPKVSVDSRMMKQVFINLLLNSAQAMPGGGTLSIDAMLDTTPPLARVRVDVRDSGTGFSPELGERIFQPFFTTKAAGTGLGLALVKRVMDSHKAEVRVSSVPAQGTTFSLWLKPA